MIFVFWLQGAFELGALRANVAPTQDQIDLIKKHLDMVFIHEIDPSMGDKAHQDKLNAAHTGKFDGYPDGTVMRC